MNYFKEAVDLLPQTWQRIVYGNRAIARKQHVDDILTDHVGALIDGTHASKLYLDQYPDERVLASLLPLAEHVNEHLYPVAPTAGFRNRLLNDLMRQAHAQHERGNPSLWTEKRKEIIIGATITSVISAVGVLAYFMHILPFNRRPTSTG